MGLHFKIVNSYLIWGGLALQFAHQIENLKEEKLIGDFFESIVR